jgi:hypothetical protein
VAPPLPQKRDWEVDPEELDFSSSLLIGKVWIWRDPSVSLRNREVLRHGDGLSDPIVCSAERELCNGDGLSDLI